MKVVFMGTPDFAVPTLQAINEANYEIPLVITQPDRKKGRGKKLQAPPVKLIAERLGLQVFQPYSIRVQETIDLLRRIAPEIISSEGTQIDMEGCLSVPGIRGEVARGDKIVVTGLNRSGEKLEIKAEGMLSRAFQHEIDHLDGILFIDIANNLEKVD